MDTSIIIHISAIFCDWLPEDTTPVKPALLWRRAAFGTLQRQVKGGLQWIAITQFLLQRTKSWGSPVEKVWRFLIGTLILQWVGTLILQKIRDFMGRWSFKFVMLSGTWSKPGWVHGNPSGSWWEPSWDAELFKTMVFFDGIFLRSKGFMRSSPWKHGDVAKICQDMPRDCDLRRVIWPIRKRCWFDQPT